MDIKKIVDDVFLQAEKGVVNLKTQNQEQWKFYTRFYYKIEDKTNLKLNNKYPIVYIPNYNVFLKEIQKYIVVAKDFYKDDKNYFDLNEEEFAKKLFLDLVINACNYDLINFIDYVKLKTQILENVLTENEFIIGKYNEFEIYGKIAKNKSNIESPYRFDVIFKDQLNNQFLLPSILFGTNKEQCFVYSIQNLNKGPKNLLSKKLDRYFRKVNKNVDMENDIYNVSPNAVVSFVIFVEYLKSKNISKFVNSNFMPIRYHASKIAGYKHCEENFEKSQFLQKHEQNQFNITNKLINMFFRYENHFNNSIVSFDNIKQQIKIDIGKEDYQNQDNIICDIAREIEKFNQQTFEK